MLSNGDILGLLSDVIQSRPGVRIPVSGKSMGPAFAQVSDIMVKIPGRDAIRPGALVVFQRGGLWVVHRVVGKARGGAGYLTKGDGLDRLDEPSIHPDEIKGIVVGFGLSDGGFVDLCSPGSRLKAWMRVVRWRAARFCRDPRPAHRA